MKTEKELWTISNKYVNYSLLGQDITHHNFNIFIIVLSYFSRSLGGMKYSIKSDKKMNRKKRP
jgi:hypothetical protein